MIVFDFFTESQRGITPQVTFTVSSVGFLCSIFLTKAEENSHVSISNGEMMADHHMDV